MKYEPMMKRFTRLFQPLLGMLMLGLILPATLAAGDQTTLRSLPNEPGKWRPWTCGDLSASDLKNLGFSRTDADSFKARLQQIAEIFRLSPVWNPPLGVDPSLSGSFFGPSSYFPYAKKRKGQPIAGIIMMGCFDHYEVIRTTGGKEQREHEVNGETSHIMVDVNWLPGGDGVNMLSDDEGEFYEEPVRTADIGGFPTYGDRLIVAKNGKPLWKPITRERFLKAFIAKHRSNAANAEIYIAEKQKELDAFIAPAAVAARQAKYKAAIEKMASKGAPAVEHERRYWERDEADNLAALKRGASHNPKENSFAAVIASVKTAEEQLGSMSPAERSAPAAFLEDLKDLSKTGLVPAGTPKSKALVGRNPEFFDPQLPRSVPQIIVIQRFRGLEKTWSKGRPDENENGSLDLWTTYEAFRQADWKKLAEQIGR